MEWRFASLRWRGRSEFRIAAAIAAAALVASCGGGSGGGSSSGSPPIVQAVVLNLPANLATGFIPSGMSTAAEVRVLTPAGLTVSDATVTVNGQALAYDAGNQGYVGYLTVADGAPVTISANVGGTVYTEGGTQFASPPVLTSPLDNSVQSSASPVQASWSGVPATSDVKLALGLFDALGNALDVNNAFTFVSPGASPYALTAPPGTSETRMLLAGSVRTIPAANLGAGSALVVGSFSACRIILVSTPQAVGTLTALQVTTPTGEILAQNGWTPTVLGTFSGGSGVNLNGQVTWTTSNPAVVSLDSSGQPVAQGEGSAMLTAQLGNFTSTATVQVFAPSPTTSSGPLTQATTQQVDPGHGGFATVGGSPVFPASASWTRSFPYAISGYPLITAGKVFVDTGSNQLYALDEASGSVLWGPVNLGATVAAQPDGTQLAYEHGVVFALRPSGGLYAIDAATGVAKWNIDVPTALGQPGATTGGAPTAANGLVYVPVSLGAQASGYLAAIDEANGLALWSVQMAGFPMGSAAAVETAQVVTGSPCGSLAVDLYTGMVRTQNPLSCNATLGTLASVPAYSAYASRVVLTSSSDPVAGAVMVDPGTGGSYGPILAGGPVAYAGNLAYGLLNGQLVASQPPAAAPAWSVPAGTYPSSGAPLLIDGAVVLRVGSSMVAFDAQTGAQLWSNPAPGGSLAGTNAGDGYLVTGAGSQISAWRLIP